MCLAGFRRRGLDHVWVNSALRQEGNVFQLTGFFIEHLDKGIANNFTLGFRIRYTFQLAQEQVLSVGTDHFNAHVLGEHVHHHIAFVLTQQTIVNENTGQLIADGFVQQRRHNR